MERVSGAVSSWVRLHPSKQQIDNITKSDTTPKSKQQGNWSSPPKILFQEGPLCPLRLSFPGLWLFFPLELVSCRGTNNSNLHLLEKICLLSVFSLLGCFAVLFFCRTKGSAYPQTRGHFETNVGSEMGRDNSTCRASISVNSNNTTQFTSIADITALQLFYSVSF